MRSPERNSDMYFDANGRLTERIMIGDQEVRVTYDDIPESDITTVRGLPCTTPLRTVIDLALELERPELERIVRDCLDRELFTPEEARSRMAQPDLHDHRGGHLLLKVIAEITGRRA